MAACRESIIQIYRQQEERGRGGRGGGRGGAEDNHDLALPFLEL